MLGIFFVSLGALMTELGESIGKDQVEKGKQTIYTMGFLGMFVGALLFGILAFFRGSFVFVLASLPTFALRALLEILQAHYTMRAAVAADRSTFGFLRTLTIPLLLLVDVLLGYPLSLFQLIGMLLIAATLSVLLMQQGLKREGMWLVLFTAINAVVTISLFKYNISHFNSVEAEQGIMYVILLVYFLWGAWHVGKENPLRKLKDRLPRTQSLAYGIAGILESFAYLFAPASVITTGKRASAVIWSILSGSMYFHETKLGTKVTAFAFIVVGLIFLLL